MDDWKYVTKEEMVAFIQNYPCRLEQDFYMDWYSWNDFRNGRIWPESVVAMAFVYGEVSEYKIRDCYLSE